MGERLMRNICFVFLFFRNDRDNREVIRKMFCILIRKSVDCMW